MKAYSLVLDNVEYRLGQEGRQLIVQDYDLESERMAFYVSGVLLRDIHVLLVISDLIKNGEELKKVLKRFKRNYSAWKKGRLDFLDSDIDEVTTAVMAHRTVDNMIYGPTSWVGGVKINSLTAKFLTTHQDIHARAHLASSSHINESILRKLYLDENWRVRTEVLRNPKCPVDLLSLAVKRGDLDEIVSVAKNPCTPPEDLEYLLDDAIIQIKNIKRAQQNIYNPNMPDEILNNQKVLCDLIRNPNLRDEVVVKALALDESVVALLILERENLSPALRQQILRIKLPSWDENYTTCRIAKEFCLNYEEQLEFLLDERVEVRNELAKNKFLFPSIILALRKDENETVQRQIKSKFYSKLLRAIWARAFAG